MNASGITDSHEGVSWSELQHQYSAV